LRGARPAQRREFEPLHAAQPQRPRHAACGEAVLEAGKQRHRREALAGHARDEAQEGAGLALHQRLAGGVVGRDAVPRERRRDAAREVTVGCHECCARAGMLERLAQQQRDGGGLLRRIGGVEALHVGERAAPALRRALAPGAVGDDRHQHRDADDRHRERGRAAPDNNGLYWIERTNLLGKRPLNPISSVVTPSAETPRAAR